MKTFLSAIALVVALIGPARAADVYPRSMKDDADYTPFVGWTGFYVGVHGGYGSGEFDGQPVYDPGTGPVTSFFSPGQIDVDGGLGGVTLGAQRQMGGLVLGVEVDGSWGDLGGENTFDATGASKGYHWSIDTSIDGLYTARARVGVAMGSLMIYATGGLAVAQVSMDETVTADKSQGFPKDGTVTALASSDENMLGWVAGGGAEWQFAPGWSLKAEALYVDLGEVENRFKGTAYPGTLDLPHTTDSYDADLGITIVRAGVNYRF